MGIRQDILTVLRGGQPERIPWTIYAAQLFRGRVERDARNKGLGILRSWPVCITSTPNVDVEAHTFWKDGKQYALRTYHTPVGSVSEKIAFASGYYNEGQVRVTSVNVVF